MLFCLLGVLYLMHIASRWFYFIFFKGSVVIKNISYIEKKYIYIYERDTYGVIIIVVESKDCDLSVPFI